MCVCACMCVCARAYLVHTLILLSYTCKVVCACVTACEHACTYGYAGTQRKYVCLSICPFDHLVVGRSIYMLAFLCICFVFLTDYPLSDPPRHTLRGGGLDQWVDASICRLSVLRTAVFGSTNSRKAFHGPTASCLPINIYLPNSVLRPIAAILTPKWSVASPPPAS